ncbi:MAG: hypothetical protein JKY01_03385 [Pseudomonadales bacterium]|nr:hypothetical protein [Pseudomonadales bacterium]
MPASNMVNTLPMYDIGIFSLELWATAVDVVTVQRARAARYFSGVTMRRFP